MQRRLRVLLAVLTMSVCLGGGIVGVNANHSVPSPMKFWDGNDNGLPSGEPDFDNNAGTHWTASHVNRLMEATAEWTNDTEYDPGVADTSNNIYVNGTLPPAALNCLNSWNSPDGDVVLAVTCRTDQPRHNSTLGDYFRIVNADIYFNMERSGAPNWWVGASMPSEANRFDFGGILTHEIGHTLRLQHVPSSGCPFNSTNWITMCPLYSGNQDSYWSRSLHADDKSSANFVY